MARGMSNSSGGDLVDLLLDHPFGPDDGLLFTIDQAVTAGEARMAVAALADTLRRAGVEPGQAVAVARANDTTYVIAMFAVWAAGAVFVPINRRAPEVDRRYSLEATGARFLIDDDGVQKVDIAGTQIVDVDGVQIVDLDGAPGAEPRRYNPGDAFVLWTSGTTGRPKPIVHTHRAYLELLDRVLGPLRAAGGGPATPGDRPPASAAASRKPSPNLIPASLALNAGIYNVLFGLRAGASVVIMDGFDPGVFAELVRRFEIRSTVLPPAAMTMLADRTDITSLAPLKYVRSITAPLSPLQARRFFDRFGAAVLNSYGQAEVGEVIGWTAADWKQHADKVGAAGRPLPGVDIRIVDESGAPVPIGEVGRIMVRPPSMAAGYASGHELSDRIDADGFVDMGDLARVDPDGFVWIEGRSGDLINRGGNKIFPEQVEEVLVLSPSVDEAAVVGVPDPRLGQVPVAFVVTNAEVTDADLDRLCREHLVPYKVPVAYRRIDSLPRTDVGKLRRSALVELATVAEPPS